MSTMRIGGLASGMDIDSLVEKLMVAERAPLDKLEQKKQTYEWQRDAYRDVNKKLQTFDTYIADNLILKSLNTKSATSSNSELVSVAATSAASGTLSIEGVSQLATAARKVGDLIKTKSGIVADGKTKISDLAGSAFSGTTEQSILLKSITKNGTLAAEATEIKFNSSDTIDDVIKKINSSNAGVTVFFENGKLSVTATNTGALKEAGAEVQLVPSQTKNGQTINGTGNALFSLLGVKSSDAGNPDALVDGGQNAILRVNGIDTERSSNTFTLNGYNITLKNTFNSNATLQNRITALGESITATQITIDQLQSKISQLKSEDGNSGEVKDKEDAYDSALDMFGGMNTAILSADIKEIFSSMTYQQITDIVGNDLTEESLDGITELTPEQKDDLIALSPEEKAQLKGYNEETLKNVKRFSAYEKLDEESKVLLSSMTEPYINELDSIADLTLNSDIDASTLTDDQKTLLKSFSTEQREILASLTAEDLKGIRVVVNTKNEYEAKTAELTAAETQLTGAQAQLTEYQTQKTEAESALATTPIDETAGKAVTLNSSTNVDEMVTKIKDFVTTYNGLITDLKNLTTETKYRDYKPLTTLQRKELEEKEIELWDEKAKSGLLRGDSIIRSGLSSMRSLIYQSNPAVANPKYNTLYNIGITTSKNYNAGGTLEIDETKLRAALEADPDAVTKLLTFSDGKEKDSVVVDGVTKEVDTRGFMQKLRGEMTNIKLKIEERAGRSTMTDAQYTIGKNLRSVNDSIDTWQDKLTAIENRYWRQFTAMETMINKANNQSAMLMGQFY